MSWLLAALGVLCVGAVLCLPGGRRPGAARVLGPTVAVTGACLGIIPACAVLVGKPPLAGCWPWALPFGSFSIEMDPLSAVFAVPVLVVSALAAVFGSGYLGAGEGDGQAARSWFFYNVLTASMLLVIVARNAVLFLLAWEIMSLASFFLVLFDSGREEARRAGWIYLVATHIGTAFLLVMFVLLGGTGPTLDFSGFSGVDRSAAGAGVVFVLAVIGFGTKAGFMPMHVWLPEAHPAAPSHVSAVMSGVMIKTGIYGLVRVLTFLGAPPSWWGWVLVCVGVISGVGGVLFALAQHDLKRLLAYHSVENIGIIALGLGVGLLGVNCGRSAMAFLGFAGALLHVINHAAFKSLLFLGAGAIVHATGTRDIEHLGGVLRRMPVTGLSFLVGSVAICGLPPLNGFVSEFLIYLASAGAFVGAPALHAGALAAPLAVMTALALIGALAVACFTKAFGVVFLGEPRGEHAARAHEVAGSMQGPMGALGFACVAIGFAGPLMLELIRPAAAGLAEAMGLPADAPWAGQALGMVAAVGGGVLAMAGLLALVRRRLLAGRSVAVAGTWDCGYAAPTPRMQYTASSFADPILGLFRLFLCTRREFTPPTGLFPRRSTFSSRTPDPWQERVYRPVFLLLERALARFRWLQHGRLNLYILCIVAALLALVAWKLR